MIQPTFVICAFSMLDINLLELHRLLFSSCCILDLKFLNSMLSATFSEHSHLNTISESGLCQVIISNIK